MRGWSWYVWENKYEKKNSVNEGYIIGTLGNGEANILVNQVGLQAKLKNYININGLTGEAYLHEETTNNSRSFNASHHWCNRGINRSLKFGVQWTLNNRRISALCSVTYLLFLQETAYKLDGSTQRKKGGALQILRTQNNDKL